MMRKRHIIAAIALIMGAVTASAQYYQLANQLANMATTAATGGMNYRGYADVSYLAGVGNKRSDFLDISTTQGIKCSNVFFIGVGVGVDVMFTSVKDYAPSLPPIGNHGTTQTAAAIPIFSDFRLTLGNPSSTGFFADLKVGASFLTGNNYIRVGDGYLLNSQCFYLKPTVGVRIPLSTSNPKLALNAGLSYMLMTSSTWYVNNNSMTLNAIGASIGIEW